MIKGKASVVQDTILRYALTSGKWNLAVTGILLLIYMTIHLFQFRFGATQPSTRAQLSYLRLLKCITHFGEVSDSMAASVT